MAIFLCSQAEKWVLGMLPQVQGHTEPVGLQLQPLESLSAN